MPIPCSSASVGVKCGLQTYLVLLCHTVLMLKSLLSVFAECSCAMSGIPNNRKHCFLVQIRNSSKTIMLLIRFAAFNSPCSPLFFPGIFLPRMRGTQNEVTFLGCSAEIQLKRAFRRSAFSFSPFLESLEYFYSSVLSPVTLQVLVDVCRDLLSFGQNIQVL